MATTPNSFDHWFHSTYPKTTAESIFGDPELNCFTKRELENAWIAGTQSRNTEIIAAHAEAIGYRLALENAIKTVIRKPSLWQRLFGK